jgi:hypothetical protein
MKVKLAEALKLLTYANSKQLKCQHSAGLSVIVNHTTKSQNGANVDKSDT